MLQYVVHYFLFSHGLKSFCIEILFVLKFFEIVLKNLKRFLML